MNEYDGFVKLQRRLLASSLWESAYQLTLYIYCLLNATYIPYNGLKPGQFYTSAPSIVKAIMQSRNGVRNQLKKLEALGVIQVERDDRGLLITVTDWEKDCGTMAGFEAYSVASEQDLHAAQEGHGLGSGSHTMTSKGHDMDSAGGHGMTSQAGSPIGPTQEYIVLQEKKKEKDKQEQQEPLSHSPRGPEAPVIPEERGEGERFEEFWEAYPKKQARMNALRAWRRLNPDRALCARIMEGLRRWKASAEWQREGGRFVPLPAAWLEGYRWAASALRR